MVIGDGKWSKNHQRILQESNIDQKIFDIDVTPEQMIKTGTPDAVIITASTVNHFPLSLFFMKMGIPVFCEKPICLELWQLDILSYYAKGMDSTFPIFMAGHQLTFDPTVRTLEMQKPRYFSSKRTGAIPRTEGAIMSLAVHDIAIAMRLFSHHGPYEISATGNQHTAHAIVTWPGGCTAEFYVQSIAQVPLRHASIVTDTGSITRIDPSCWSRIDLLKAELEHFIFCVKTKCLPSRNGLEDAIAVTDLAIKIRDTINNQQ